MINEDKWESSTSRRMRKKLMNDPNLSWLDPPYEKDEKLKNVKQLILMNVQNNFFGEPRSHKEYNFLAQVLRALLSNKNGILYFWKKSIIQQLQNCAQIY